MTSKPRAIRPTTVPPARARAVPARQHGRPRPLRIGAKLKSALDMLVYGDANGNPLSWDECARAANYDVRSMRKAMEKGHVRRLPEREEGRISRGPIGS